MNTPDFQPYIWDQSEVVGDTIAVFHELYLWAYMKRSRGDKLGWGNGSKRTTASLDDLVPEGAQLLGDVLNGDYSARVYKWIAEGQEVAGSFSYRKGSVQASICVCAADATIAQKIVDSILETAPPYTVDEPDVVPVQFWTLTPNGPRATTRNLDINLWEDTADNYPEPVRAQLDAAIQWKTPPAGGQLMLLHGAPGTGKTSLIRSLAAAWKDWCEVSYVVDPDEFFNHAYYMVDVLLSGSEMGDDNWRLIIVEDADKLIGPESKQTTGQALPRLLNICDGLVGQGLKILVLITTNESFKELHKAVTRPGRCLLQVDFETFTAEEATIWLKNHDYNGTIEKMPSKVTLADLYSFLRGEVPGAQTQIGFSR